MTLSEVEVSLSNIVRPIQKPWRERRGQRKGDGEWGKEKKTGREERRKEIR